jgi:Uma2 family endonuclease
MATKARLTPDDIFEISDRDHRYELVNGEIIKMPPPNYLHGFVVAQTARRLSDFVDRSRAGAVVAGGGCILELPQDPDRVREPDVAFVSESRFEGGKLPRKYLRGAPDLAVEVISPSDRVVEVEQRVRDLLEAGARMVWVLSPESRTATVYRAAGSARLLNESDDLDGEDILPGFHLPLAEFFPPA